MNDLMYQIQEISVPQFSFALNPDGKDAPEPNLQIGGAIELKGEELTVLIHVSSVRDSKSKYFLDAVAVGVLNIKNYVDGESQRKILKRIGFGTVFPYLRSSIASATSALVSFRLNLGIIDIDSVFEKTDVKISD